MNRRAFFAIVVAMGSAVTFLRTFDALGQDVPRATVSVDLGGDRLLFYPKDPARPFEEHDWNYLPPVRTSTSTSYDPVLRKLQVVARFGITSEEEARAKLLLSQKYQAVGRGQINPVDINVDPVVPIGYKVFLHSGKLEIAIGSGGRGFQRELVASYNVPDNEKELHETLTTHPNSVSVRFDVSYPFDNLVRAEVTGRKTVQVIRKTLESVLPNNGFDTAQRSGAIIVSRDVTQKFTETISERFEYSIKHDDQVSDALLDKILPLVREWSAGQIAGDISEISNGTYFAYNERTQELEMRPDIVQNITTELDTHSKERTKLDDFVDQVSDLSTRDLNTEEWYNQIKAKIHAAGSLGLDVFEIFSVDSSLDFESNYESLDSGKKVLLNELQKHSRDLRSRKHELERISDVKFRGRLAQDRTVPKDLQITRISFANLERDSGFSAKIERIVRDQPFTFSTTLSLGEDTDNVSSVQLTQLQNQLQSMLKDLGQQTAELARLRDQVTQLKATSEADRASVQAEKDYVRGMLQGLTSSIPAMLDRGKLRYGTYQQVFCFGTSKSTTDVMAPAGANLEWPLPANTTFGKRIIGVWATPQNAIEAIKDVTMLYCKPVGNSFRVYISGKPTNARIQFEFHVLYYED